MIRIREHLYKICLYLFLSFISIPCFAQLNMGARGLGLGQATTALIDYEWSLFSNPALVNNEEIAVGFYGLRNYGFSNLTDMAATGSVPTKFGVTSVGFHRYGDNLFNETRIRVGYKNMWQMLHFGLALNYNHISFGGDYGSGGAVGIDVGIAAQLLSDLWIGAKSSNVNNPAYDGINEELARDISIGFTYSLNELALLSFDLVKDVRFPISYRGGVEMDFVEGLTGRIGITTEPISYSFGFGYSMTRWDINVAVQKHELLGFSPGIDFMLYF